MQSHLSTRGTEHRLQTAMQANTPNGRLGWPTFSQPRNSILPIETRLHEEAREGRPIAARNNATSRGSGKALRPIMQ